MPRKRRYFSVRVYKDDGTSRGQTTLDAQVDKVGDVPVDTLQLAEEYARKYLTFKGE